MASQLRMEALAYEADRLLRDLLHTASAFRKPSQLDKASKDDS